MSQCPRCELAICICGLQGYIAVPLPMKFHPAFPGHEELDDNEGMSLNLALNAVIKRWFDGGLTVLDVIDALNGVEKKDTNVI
jgi:hypothetical protein